MIIRRANIHDIELLQQIGRKTFDDTFGGTCTIQDMQFVLEQYFNYEQCKKELTDPEDYFYFLEENNTVKGYLRINNKHKTPIEEIKNERCVELVRLYVLKEYHGSYIAKTLMEFAFDFAQKNNFNRIYLSVWEYNFRARGFYEKMGFYNSGIKNDFPLGTTPQTDYWYIKKL